MAIKEIGDQFRNGNLETALVNAKEYVRDNPECEQGRSLLLQLYLFAGEFDKASRQLDVLELNHQADPASFINLKLIAEMINAAIKRREFFRQVTELPLMFEEDRPWLEPAYQLLSAFQAGALEAGQVEQLLDQARQEFNFSCLTQDDPEAGLLIEPDDMTAPLLEVFTPKSGYSWLAWHNISSVEFFPYEKPIDLMFRRALIKRIGDDPSASPMPVYVPVVYAPTPLTDTNASMGRVTDWVASETTGLVQGIGQKCLLIGDELVPLLQIRALERAGMPG